MKTEENVTPEEMEVEEPSSEFVNFSTDRFAFLVDTVEDEESPEFEFQIVRPIRCTLGFLECAHGSVKLYQGDTCVICAVYGPSDVRMSKELPHRAAVDVLFRPKVTGTSQLSQNTAMDPTWEERTIEAIVVGIMESTIMLEDDIGAGFNIILHEYENDGCLLSTCVNAAVIALMNAGCSLRHPIAAVTIVLTKDGRLIIDPSTNQLKDGIQATMVFVFSNQGHVLYTNLQGLASKRVLQVSLEQAEIAVKELFRFYNKLLHYDNRNEEGYKEIEEDVDGKDSIVDDDSDEPEKLNFTDLKVETESEEESDEDAAESKEEIDSEED